MGVWEYRGMGDCLKIEDRELKTAIVSRPNAILEMLSSILKTPLPHAHTPILPYR